jgi:hypothetical protein
MMPPCGLALQSSGLLERIATAWADTTAPLVREGAMLAFTAVCNDVGSPAEPFLLPLLDTLLSHYADKVPSIMLYVVLRSHTLVCHHLCCAITLMCQHTCAAGGYSRHRPLASLVQVCIPLM